MRWTLLVLTSLFLQPLPAAMGRDQQGPSPEYLRFATTYAERILRELPPDKYFILNYGATTAVTSAYLRWAIPSEAARRDYYAELMLFRGREVFAQEIWDEIFDRILPSDEVLRGRTLIIHRYLWLGRTVGTMLEKLLKYRAKYRPDLKLGTFLIGTKDLVPATDQFSTFIYIHNPTEYATVRRYVDRYSEPIQTLYALAETLPVDIRDVRANGPDALGAPNPNRLEIERKFLSPFNRFRISQPSLWEKLKCAYLLQKNLDLDSSPLYLWHIH